MDLKGLHIADVAEVQKAVIDELKNVQKEEISIVFRKCTTSKEPINMPMEHTLNKNKGIYVPHMSPDFKKSVLKLLDRTVDRHYQWHIIANRPVSHQPRTDWCCFQLCSPVQQESVTATTTQKQQAKL
jgi:hypothetical protein